MHYTCTTDKLNAEINTAIDRLVVTLREEYDVSVDNSPAWGININGKYLSFDVTLEQVGHGHYQKPSGKWRIYIGSTSRRYRRRLYVRSFADGTVGTVKFANKVMQVFAREQSELNVRQAVETASESNHKFIDQLRATREWNHVSPLTVGRSGQLRIDTQVDQDLAVKILDLIAGHNEK